MAGHKLFMMWEPFRESLIAGHTFYVEQAFNRLLSQFGNIEAEANKVAEDWLDQRVAYFDPDRHDPSGFYEAAQDAGVEFYQLLGDMRDMTQLSVVAGMYHEWDKRFRKWLIEEMRHWHRGEQVTTKMWSVDAGKIFDLLASFGWDIRSKEYFQKLDICRLVVNVFKHGDGRSFSDLKSNYPEYLSNSLVGFCDDMDWLDHTNLKVNDSQIQEFSEAIIAFWRDVPREILSSSVASVPDWFGTALSNDRKAKMEGN
jgi:hypothetical protein